MNQEKNVFSLLLCIVILSCTALPCFALDETQQPVIIDTVYPTDDIVIADIIATKAPYNADNTGVADSTAAIQKAIDDGYKKFIITKLKNGVSYLMFYEYYSLLKKHGYNNFEADFTIERNISSSKYILFFSLHMLIRILDPQIYPLYLFQNEDVS